MNRSFSDAQSAKDSKILENTLRLHQAVVKTKNHLIWGVVNVSLVAALVYSILNTIVDETVKTVVLYQGQCLLAGILSINSCFHIIQYLFKSVTLKPVILSPSQRRLLGISESDRYFKAAELSPKAPEARKDARAIFTSTYPMNLTAESWELCTGQNETSNSNRSFAQVPSPTPILSPQTWLPSTPGDEPITDERSLSRFLEAFDDQVNRSVVGMSVESLSPTHSPFWNNPSPRASSGAEVSPLLRRCAYQTASVSPVTPSSSPGVSAEDSTSPSTISHTEFWRRVKVDPNRLTQWNANLRMWISLTILQRVVEELDHIDAAFVRCGLSDLHLGSVGLDRLKRTACIPQVVTSIPSLPRLVPFLELSQHQEYLVTRIRELAKGGSMSEFRWNSGGSLHGKPWEEHLPTDAALVMHLVATYLDLQLVPAPQRLDAPPARPFSSQYLVRTPERPPAKPHGPVIHQVQLNPPHFVLNDKDHFYDVPKGRNNVFHTLLLFLHLLKTHEHGMLGPVNLGRSGVNVLWVVDS